MLRRFLFSMNLMILSIYLTQLNTFTFSLISEWNKKWFNLILPREQKQFAASWS